jgi:LmbE family N-acetylglucosaminyl deacetylase
MASTTHGRRIVVVSPHLDDGVLSLGAAMAMWARGGARVEQLTVFACDPESDAETGGWDGRAGFRTEAEAARGRRAEDARACTVLGVVPRWLPFGSVDFDRHGDESDVCEAVRSVVQDADAVLLPGYPLTHPDHEWLVRTLTSTELGVGRLGLYAEQPYAHRTKGDPQVPEWLEETFGGRPEFDLVPATVGDRVSKWRAIRRYRTQLPLLGMQRSMRRGPHSILWDEAVAWIPEPPP